MQTQFASVCQLIDKVVEGWAHQSQLKCPSLYLYVGSEQSQALHFYDSTKTKLVINEGDLESYLQSSLDKIEKDSTIWLQKCEVHLEFGKDNQVSKCEIESKNVHVDAGTSSDKKIKSFGLKVHVDVTAFPNGEIPLLPSTRRYLRKIEKAKLATKYQNKKLDILNFVTPANSNPEGTQNEIYRENLSTLDTNSLEILKKLTGFINKEELLRILIKQPLRNKNSKKVVRMMVVPSVSGNDMNVVKKTYNRNVLQQLIKEYQDAEK